MQRSSPLRGHLLVPAHLVGAISDSAIITLAVATKLAQSGHTLTRRSLATLRRLSTRQIQRHLAELEAAGLLERSYDPVNHTAEYRPLCILPVAGGER